MFLRLKLKSAESSPAPVVDLSLQ